MENPTFFVTQKGTVIFQSDKRWLFPLFEFIDLSILNKIDTRTFEVHDKVVGKAAALLMLYIGVGCVHADVISELACAVLTRASASFTYKNRVARIDCQTEELLLNVDDPVTAYRMLKERASRAQQDHS